MLGPMCSAGGGWQRVRVELSNMEERYDAAWVVIGRLLSQ
jgi:hypothetical protein